MVGGGACDAPVLRPPQRQAKAYGLGERDAAVLTSVRINSCHACPGSLSEEMVQDLRAHHENMFLETTGGTTCSVVLAKTS